MSLDKDQFDAALSGALPTLSGPAVKSGLAVIDELEEDFWEDTGPSETVSINFD